MLEMTRLPCRARPLCLAISAGLALVAASAGAAAPTPAPAAALAGLTWTGTNAAIEARVDALLAQMTLEEKVGQLNQFSSEAATGPVSAKAERASAIREGRVGSLLNVVGAARTRELQAQAMQSRLKIPLLFGDDVIHGLRTTFPIPLAEAASWDLEAMERSARIAATEAAAAGLHWTFAPMVDVARDPRWGRVMEGAGEDPFLGARIAVARVHGFQGDVPGALDAVMATAKHFAGYGAAIGGRDYNTTDMSERTLREVILPPFKAAAEAGVATFMNSFNDLNGTPATASSHLQRGILKGEWGYGGFVVSDWNSIGELVPHGVAGDLRAAARLAINAGNDMDMESDAYADNLAQLVRDGQVPVATVDEAVRRVLRAKFRLGLFDDPFRFSDTKREQRVLNDPASARFARQLARESIVLLRNEAGLLPLAPAGKAIALIGPLAKATKDNLGGWSVELDGLDYDKLVKPQYEGLRARLPASAHLLYAQGCGVDDPSTAGIAAAVATARQADVVILSVGESRDMSGEAHSRSNLHLPGVQEELVRAVVATGKPVVMLVNAGRPLVLDWEAAHVPAIVYAWWLGSEAADAIADVLLGDYNPGGRLPISLPRSEGQIPVYYAYPNTGRPGTENDQGHRTGYNDLPRTPLYPFGYGLSYTRFSYEALELDRHELHGDQRLVASVRIANTGSRSGAEVVQLYLRELVASVERPLHELRGFERVVLQPGESRTVRFTVDREALSFYDAQLDRVTEPGDFELQVGASAEDIRLRERFSLRD
jgi:beta-glucosidase